jgi:hypothetical protein
LFDLKHHVSRSSILCYRIIARYPRGVPSEESRASGRARPRGSRENARPAASRACACARARRAPVPVRIRATRAPTSRGSGAVGRKQEPTTSSGGVESLAASGATVLQKHLVTARPLGSRRPNRAVRADYNRERETERLLWSCLCNAPPVHTAGSSCPP